jgi:large subunit ribosomal protein L7/L12
MTNTEIVEAISGMTVLEVSKLVRELRDKFDLPDIAVVQQQVPATMPTSPEESEPTEFNLFLQAVGPRKIHVIKAVRTITGLGLRESKTVVDGIPCPILEAVSKHEVESARAVLEDAGATVAVEAC